MSMLTKFKKNGEIICPYNGSWIQCPIVKEGTDYVPVVRQPDAHILNMDVNVFKKNGKDSAKVTITIRNGGSASINEQTPIAFYDGGTTGRPLAQASLIDSRMVGIDIFPDEKVTFTCTLPGDFNDKLIWARIMDNNGTFPATGYFDCNLRNNMFSAIDCPYLNYSITASPDTLFCRSTDTILLTAVAAKPEQHKPTYQWYRDDILISGATEKTYPAAMAGEYKCYVTEDICRKFSTAKKLTRVTPIVVSIEKTELCIGTTTKLSPDTGGIWTSSNTNVVAIDKNKIATGKSSGTATLTYQSSTTGCAEKIAITVDTFPLVADITGVKIVCQGKTIRLSNSDTSGVWTSNNTHITFNDPHANPVTVTGVKEGKTYITYTVSNGVCQTKKTFLLKVIHNKHPVIMVGFPR
jgi:hypothetical protein